MAISEHKWEGSEHRDNERSGALIKSFHGTSAESTQTMKDGASVTLAERPTILGISTTDIFNLGGIYPPDGVKTIAVRNASTATSTIKADNTSSDKDWTEKVRDLRQELLKRARERENTPSTNSTVCAGSIKTRLMYLETSEVWTEDEVKRLVEVRTLRRQALKDMDWKKVKLYSKELFESTGHHGYSSWLRD